MSDRRRILTNRNFEQAGAYEAIEVGKDGEFYWRAFEPALQGEGLKVSECCFPVDLDFVREKFLECGRIFDETRV